MTITAEQLAQWEHIEQRATKGPWSWWTSNSFRRLSSDPTGKDGDVLCGDIQQSDGHPDVLCSEEDREFIAAARTAMPALLAEVRRLRADEELYTEPDYRLAVRAWLRSFRIAVDAAGLSWVKPDLDIDPEWYATEEEREDDSPSFYWRDGLVCLRSTTEPLTGRIENAPDEDISACVDLYRRWLARRSTP